MDRVVANTLWKEVLGLINRDFKAIILSLIFVALYSYVSVHLLYDSYVATAFDLGIFTQSLKYTLEGYPLFNTAWGFSQMATHFSPILFLLVPFYWLAPYAQTLLFIQAVALGLGGYLVYHLSKSFGLGDGTSLFVELLFLINPLTWGLVLFDFHEISLAVPTLLAMMVGMVKKNRTLFISLCENTL